MTVIQPEIEKIKEDFTEITKSTAEENPIDFCVYLHLLEVNKMDQLMSYMELKSNVSHKPSWAEIKNYLDELHEAKVSDNHLA